MATLRIATRGSPLARWQAEFVAASLTDAHPGVECELVIVSTEGDRRTDVPLAVIGGKGVFVKEIQHAVLDGRADVAVHSAKDLPAVTSEGLVIAAAPQRADPADGLVGRRLDDIALGGSVATGSQRRAAQLRALRPDLEIRPLRGNMDRRIDAARHHDAVVVAAAALDRLGRGSELAQRFDTEVMVPQVGQGTMAVECRAGDASTWELLAPLEHGPTRTALDAERAFLQALGGDCDLPAGAYARISPEGLTILGVLEGVDRILHRRSLVGSDGVAMGRELADALGRDAGR